MEEASLVSHMHGLAPRAALLEEAGQLGELLVLLGHAEDARTLQRAVAAWRAEYEVSGEAGTASVDGGNRAVSRGGHCKSTMVVLQVISLVEVWIS